MNISVSLRVRVHTCGVRVREDLGPPVHVDRVTGTMTAKNSWAAAAWPHTAVPQGCFEEGRLDPASPAPRRGRHRCTARRCSQTAQGHWPAQGVSKKPGASLPPLHSPYKSSNLQVLSAPILNLSICPFSSLSPLSTAVASCPSKSTIHTAVKVII